jgi:hypothetical protein
VEGGIPVVARGEIAEDGEQRPDGAPVCC